VARIVGEQVVSAEGEQVVRTYHCTSFRSRLLGIAAEGFLEVTNKRVMLQATSRGSLIHSEVPIQDVSGLGLYKGRHFSFRHLVVALILSTLVGMFATSLTTALSYAIGDENSIVSLVIAIGALVWLGRYEPHDIKKPVLASGVSALFSSAGGRSFSYAFQRSWFDGGGDSTLGVLSFIAALAVGVWALVLTVKYAIRPAVALVVNSKGGASTPIAITSPGIGPAVSGAARALEAEPAEDAEQMIRELGALILDIQERGDFGVEKWSLAQPKVQK